jgi:uncharacterized damage-inducible protein DinB
MTDLRAAWDYDLWAMERWLQALVRFPEPGEADQAATHIQRAQWIWLRRVNEAAGLGLILPSEPMAPSIVLARELNRLWAEAMDQLEPAALIAYKNQAGAAFSSAFGDIAQHVILHGSYHRGQLREMAEAQGLADFPETDFILWSRERQAP